MVHRERDLEKRFGKFIDYSVDFNASVSPKNKHLNIKMPLPVASIKDEKIKSKQPSGLTYVQRGYLKPMADKDPLS